MESEESADRLVAITSKVSPGLRDRIDAARKPEESRSAAIRRLVRAGLDTQEAEGWRDRAGRAVVLALVIGYPTLAAANGSTTIAVAWIGLVVILTLLEPFLTAAISGLPNPSDWL